MQDIKLLHLQNERYQIAEFSKASDNQIATDFIFWMKDRSFSEMSVCSEANSVEREYFHSVSFREVELIGTKCLEGLLTHEEAKFSNQ